MMATKYQPNRRSSLQNSLANRMRQASDHAVILDVRCSKPRGAQQLCPRVRHARVVLEILSGRSLRSEVPVWDGQFGVDELQTEVEPTGDERVANQEAESVVKLKEGKDGVKGSLIYHGRDISSRGGGIPTMVPVSSSTNSYSSHACTVQ